MRLLGGELTLPAADYFRMFKNGGIQDEPMRAGTVRPASHEPLFRSRGSSALGLLLEISSCRCVRGCLHNGKRAKR
jgi:hypothetical protein